MILRPFLFFLFIAFGLKAQTAAPYEQQLLQMADSTEAFLWISLNEETELLHYKEDENARPATYTASEVVSFSYGGHQYYTLPLREGYYTFFKVNHEGKEYAVLEKSPNFKMLRIIVDESKGRLSMCQNRRNHEFYLCYKDVQNTATRISPFPLSKVGELTVREFEVKKLVFLAIEGKLKLFYMKTNERLVPWDDLINIRPGNRGVENMLEEFIEDKQKITAIQKKVKQDKLDIRDPDQLILALGAVYH